MNILLSPLISQTSYFGLGQDYTIVCLHSLCRVITFCLHDIMHMGLESLEAALKSPVPKSDFTCTVSTTLICDPYMGSWILHCLALRNLTWGHASWKQSNACEIWHSLIFWKSCVYNGVACIPRPRSSRPFVKLRQSSYMYMYYYTTTWLILNLFRY